MQSLHLETREIKKRTSHSQGQGNKPERDCAVQKAEKRIRRGINGKFLAELYRCQTGIGEDNKNLMTT